MSLIDRRKPVNRPFEIPITSKGWVTSPIFDPAADWVKCPKCGIILNMMALDEAGKVWTPHPSDYNRFEASPKDVRYAGSRPEEKMIDYRLRLHLADHERAETRRATKRRRGRIPRIEAERGYRYILWAKPNVGDRRKSDYSVSLWGPEENPPGPPYAGAREVARGVTGTAYSGVEIMLRKQYADARNRERVKRHRAKSR